MKIFLKAHKLSIFPGFLNPSISNMVSSVGAFLSKTKVGAIFNIDPFFKNVIVFGNRHDYESNGTSRIPTQNIGDEIA